VDVEEHTQNVDPSAIEAAITDRTRAILVLHYAGLPADIDPIIKIAKRHGISVVEDAAHALGANYHGRPVGAIGDATSFSFGPLKMIVTAGMGGMLTMRDQGWETDVRTLISYGMNKSMWDRRNDRKPWHYGVRVLGHSFRMTDAAAAMGLAQLRKLNWILQRRRQIAMLYDRELSNIEGIKLPPDPDDCRRVYLYYVIRVDAAAFGKSPDQLAHELQERGVSISLHWAHRSTCMLSIVNTVTVRVRFQYPSAWPTRC